MPALVIWIAKVIYPIMYNKDILGSVYDFPDCTVLQYDTISDQLKPTNETIEIAQVDHEIKLVQAKTFEGAIFGLGFVHAKDRLFQLHFLRMVSQGRLSEIIGSKGIYLDQYVRLIGIKRAIEDRVTKLSSDEMVVLTNYAAGINKVAQNIKVYPLEFYLLWSSFEPWTI